MNRALFAFLFVGSELPPRLPQQVRAPHELALELVEQLCYGRLIKFALWGISLRRVMFLQMFLDHLPHLLDKLLDIRI
jgi:hypothetical protein